MPSRLLKAVGVCSLGACLPAAAPRPARAQDAPLRTARRNENAWLNANADVGLDERTSVQVEGIVARSHMGRAPQFLEFRSGVLRRLGSAARVGGGYTFVHSTPNGAIPALAPTNEHRAWQQLSLEQRVGRFSLTHRYRIEERWLTRLAARAGDAAPVRVGWTYVGRARYQLRGMLPLGAGPTAPYLTAAEELFVGFGRSVRYNVFDQNRASVALGYRVTPALRAEAGYLHQLSLKANGQQDERNHTLLVNLALTAGRHGR